MNVIDSVVVDVARIKPNIVHVVQDDSTRIIRITLLNENEPLDITADLASGESIIGLVAFKTEKGAKGEYDTLDDNTTPAVTRSLNPSDPAYSYTWDAVIEGGVTCDSGKTLLTIKFYTESGKMIQTFPITLFVHPSATPLNEPSQDYYNVVALADVQQLLTDFREDIDDVEQSEREIAGIVQGLSNDYVAFKTEVNNKLAEIGAIEDITEQFEAQSGTAEYFASSITTVGAYYFKASAESIWYLNVYNSGTDRFNVATNYKDESVIKYTWIDGALCGKTVIDFANDNPKTKIFGLTAPTEDDQAVNKGYVDSLLPTIQSGDNGKIISVVSGAYALVTPDSVWTNGNEVSY